MHFLWLNVLSAFKVVVGIKEVIFRKHIEWCPAHDKLYGSVNLYSYFYPKWQKISISEPDTHLKKIQVERRPLEKTFPILIKSNVFLGLKSSQLRFNVKLVAFGPFFKLFTLQCSLTNSVISSICWKFRNLILLTPNLQVSFCKIYIGHDGIPPLFPSATFLGTELNSSFPICRIQFYWDKNSCYLLPFRVKN